MCKEKDSEISILGLYWGRHYSLVDFLEVTPGLEVIFQDISFLLSRKWQGAKPPVKSSKRTTLLKEIMRVMFQS